MDSEIWRYYALNDAQFLSLFLALALTEQRFLCGQWILWIAKIIKKINGLNDNRRIILINSCSPVDKPFWCYYLYSINITANTSTTPTKSSTVNAWNSLNCSTSIGPKSPKIPTYSTPVRLWLRWCRIQLHLFAMT